MKSIIEFHEKHEKILLNFHFFAEIQNPPKRLNVHSEKCLFCLQFKKIIVYSVCHRSVALFLESVADDGKKSTCLAHKFASELRVKGVKKIMHRE
jgi:hypothetical protein